MGNRRHLAITCTAIIASRIARPVCGESSVSMSPELVGRLDEVFSRKAIVRELTPVLDETLAGITADG